MALDKLVDSARLDADLSSVADAIRTKGGTNGSLAFPAGFVSAVNAISGGETQIDWDGLVDGSWPTGDVELSSSITAIGDCALYNKTGITSLSAPGVTSIGRDALNGCTSLSEIDIPECVSIGAAAFRDCYLLGNARFLKCTTLVQSAFYSAGRDVPSGNRIWVFPVLTAVPADCFRQFGGDVVDLGPTCASLAARAFYQTAGGDLKELILRKTDGIVTASATNSLDKINASTKVYVPSALIASYQAASNWSTKGDVFYPLEGSVYENAYADGTPIT